MNESTRTGSEPAAAAAAPVPGYRRGPTAWFVLAGGLALMFLPSWLPAVVRTAGIDLGVSGPPVQIVWNVVGVTLLLAYVFGVERRGLDSIGLVRPSGKDLEWAFSIWGAQMTITFVAQLLWPVPQDEGTSTIAALPVAAVVALILSAAVCEEILYRGYLLERCIEFTGRRWVAVVLTAPFFIVPHLVFFGPQWLLHGAVGTIAIYALYLWRRNLVACMLLHLLGNLPILIPTIASRLG